MAINFKVNVDKQEGVFKVYICSTLDICCMGILL